MRGFKKRGILLSAVALGAAFSGRFVLDSVLLDNAPFVLFLPAVMIAGYSLGLGHGLLVTGLGLVLGDLYFQAPRGVPTVNYDTIAEGGAYLIAAFSIVALCHAVQQSKVTLGRRVLQQMQDHPRAAPDPAWRKTDVGLRAILFTDIVGSTEMTARLGDEDALELVQVHDSLVRRSLSGHGGCEIKHTGDGIMAVFDTVANAVRAAAEIQCHFANYNAGAAESLRVRIGIDAGEPVANHNGLFGATVNLAHRLCGEAEADDVLVSEMVRELSEENAVHCIALGELQLKGFAARIPVFRFDWRNLMTS